MARERETKRRRKPVKNDGKKIFDKGDSYYCEIDGEAVDSFVPSEAACKVLVTFSLASSGVLATATTAKRF